MEWQKKKEKKKYVVEEKKKYFNRKNAVKNLKYTVFGMSVLEIMFFEGLILILQAHECALFNCSLVAAWP